MSSIGQMVDSKWLERLKGDANDLTEAWATQELQEEVDYVNQNKY